MVNKCFMPYPPRVIGMGRQVNTTLDDDLYDKVCDEHDRTGKSKSQIVNDRTRSGYNGDGPSLADSILPALGQGLFVAGFVFAMFESFPLGVGLSLFGLALMIGAKVDEYKAKHNVPAWTALVRVLGA